MFNEYSDLLNVDELCQILSIGKNTAYDILNNGEVNAFKTGPVWKIPKLSVEKYILEKSNLVRQ